MGGVVEMLTGSPESPQASVVLLWVLFSMIAFCVRSKLYIRRQKRAFSEETKQLLIERMQKKKEEMLLYRHKAKIKSVEKQGWKTAALKKIGGFPQKIGRFKMHAYPYLQPEGRSDIERRKSRVQVGIIFEQFDRRQVDSTPYTDSERRSGMDRRGLIWDRRQSKVACYR
jgi:hypothetical protein